MAKDSSNVKTNARKNRLHKAGTNSAEAGPAKWYTALCVGETSAPRTGSMQSDAAPKAATAAEVRVYSRPLSFFSSGCVGKVS